MGDVLRIPRAIPAGGTLPADSTFVQEAAQLGRAFAGQPDAPKKYLLMWLLIQADRENTTMGGVLDKLVRSQPSRNDQYGLLRRYRDALKEGD